MINKRDIYKIDPIMTEPQRISTTDTTPFLSPQDRDGYVHQILSPIPSPTRPIPSFSMSSSSPCRSVFLGIDVGTGSARAGPFTPHLIYRKQFQFENTCFVVLVNLNLKECGTIIFARCQLLMCLHLCQGYERCG